MENVGGYTQNYTRNEIFSQILLWVSYCYLRHYVNVKCIMFWHSEHNFISRFSNFDILNLTFVQIGPICYPPQNHLVQGNIFQMLIQSRHLARPLYYCPWHHKRDQNQFRFRRVVLFLLFPRICEDDRLDIHWRRNDQGIFQVGSGQGWSWPWYWRCLGWLESWMWGSKRKEACHL